jgi:hypothetical protein
MMAVADIFVGEWSWGLFGRVSIPLAVVLSVVFVICTVYDNRREMYADNE